MKDSDMGKHLIGEVLDEPVLDDPTILPHMWIGDAAGEEDQVFVPEHIDLLAQELATWDFTSGTQRSTVDYGVVGFEILKPYAAPIKDIAPQIDR